MAKQKIIKLKIKKLHPHAVVPKYAKIGDAGLDLTAVSFDFTQDYVEYKTGLAVEIPEGYVGLLFPRSSISKYHLVLANSIGVIDSGYRNEICARFKMIRSGTDNAIIQQEKIYQIGDRVCQLIIMPYPIVEIEECAELSSSERGTGGFGSTGK